MFLPCSWSPQCCYVWTSLSHCPAWCGQSQWYWPQPSENLEWKSVFEMVSKKFLVPMGTCFTSRKKSVHRWAKTKIQWPRIMDTPWLTCDTHVNLKKKLRTRVWYLRKTTYHLWKFNGVFPGRSTARLGKIKWSKYSSVPWFFSKRFGWESQGRK